jgi:NAD-dependent SIR2 family protein deacetylase
MPPSAPLPLDFKQELQKRVTAHTKRAARRNDASYTIQPLSDQDIQEFSDHLRSSHRILALFGAGLSAPSGISTFRGSKDVFRGYDPPMLSTKEKLQEDPVLSWWYYAFRRHRVLKAEPNVAHYALANLGSSKEFLAITQNIDG